MNRRGLIMAALAAPFAPRLESLAPKSGGLPMTVLGQTILPVSGVLSIGDIITFGDNPTLWAVTSATSSRYRLTPA